MTKDRLKALQTVVSQDQTIEENGNHYLYDNAAIDIEDVTAGYMERFLQEIEETRQWIEEINVNVKAMKVIHSTLLSSPRVETETKQSLESTRDETCKLIKKINKKLKELDIRIQQEEEDARHEERESIGLRIRRTQYSATTHMFRESTYAFNKEQMDYKEKCEERMLRVISIAKAAVSEERLQELLDEANYGAIFSDDIIIETMEARKALQDVQARHEELLSLEKSITELRDLFIDMMIAVESHGEMINRIEKHVQDTQEYVEQGVTETKKAIVMSRKSRKKLIIIILMVVMLIAIILAVVFWPKTSIS